MKSRGGDRPYSVRELEYSLCCLRPISDGGLRILWEITRKCSLNCIHCFAGNRNYPDPSEEWCYQAIDKMAQSDVSKILLAGGEPLMRSDVFLLARYAIDHGIVVDINSNGMLIDKNIVKQARWANIDEFTISLDGAGPKTHDVQRRSPGSFKQVIKGIRTLIDSSIKVDISCCLTHLNIDEVEEMCNLAVKEGVSSIAFSGYIQVPWVPNRPSLQLSFQERIELGNLISKLSKSYSFPIRTVRLVPVSKGNTCPALKSVIFVDIEGYVHPCGLMRLSKAQTMRLENANLSETINKLKWVRRWIEKPRAINCDIKVQKNDCHGCLINSQVSEKAPKCDFLCTNKVL